MPDMELLFYISLYGLENFKLSWDEPRVSFTKQSLNLYTVYKIYVNVK